MNGTFLVLRKELREMMRDRRVIVGAFVMPVIAIFLSMKLFSIIGGSLSDAKTTAIYSVDSKPYSAMVTALRATPGLDVQIVNTEAEGRKLLEKGTAKTLLIWPAQPMVEGQPVEITAAYNSEETTSSIALRKVERWADEANKAALKEIFRLKDIPVALAEPVKINQQDNAKQKGAGDAMLVQLLPYLLILFLFTGGMNIAADLVAGEKERGTLETLLLSPVSRREIALGKFYSLITFATITSLTSILALPLTAATDPMVKKMMFPDGYSLSLGAILILILLSISLATFFASVQLAISTYAKNVREAQTFLGVANLFVIMPAAFSQVIGFTDIGRQLWVKFLPILNTAVAMREVLLGKATALSVCVPIGFALVLAAIGLAISIHLFQQERVLTRT